MNKYTKNLSLNHENHHQPYFLEYQKIEYSWLFLYKITKKIPNSKTITILVSDEVNMYQGCSRSSLNLELEGKRSC